MIKQVIKMGKQILCLKNNGKNICAFYAIALLALFAQLLAAADTTAVVFASASFNEQGLLSLTNIAKGLGTPPDYLLEKPHYWLKIDLSAANGQARTVFLPDPRFKNTEFLNPETSELTSVRFFDTNASFSVVLPAEYDTADFSDANATVLLTLDLRTLSQATPLPADVQTILPTQRTDSLNYAAIAVFLLLAGVGIVSLAAHLLKRGKDQN